MHTYTALFDQRQDAESAQNELRKLGIIPEDGVNVAPASTPTAPPGTTHSGNR